MNKKLGITLVVVFMLFTMISCVISANQKTQLALTNACVVDFSGYEGQGKANINCTIDYDHTSKIQEEFVNSISFYIEEDGTFRNGDKVILKSNYSQKTAESLNIVVEETQKEMIVTGLIEVYDTYDAIPIFQSVHYNSEAKKYLETSLKQQVEGNFFVKSYDLTQLDYIASYYQFHEDTLKGDMYLLYREQSVQEELFAIKNQYQYHCVKIKDIHSEKSFDEALLYQDMEYFSLLNDKNRKKDEEAIATLKEIIHNNIETVEELPSALIYDDEITSKLSPLFYMNK